MTSSQTARAPKRNSAGPSKLVCRTARSKRGTRGMSRWLPGSRGRVGSMASRCAGYNSAPRRSEVPGQAEEPRRRATRPRPGNRRSRPRCAQVGDLTPRYASSSRTGSPAAINGWRSLAEPGAELAILGLVELDERRVDLGLDRPLAQHPCTERVDRADIRSLDVLDGSRKPFLFDSRGGGGASSSSTCTRPRSSAAAFAWMSPPRDRRLDTFRA